MKIGGRMVVHLFFALALLALNLPLGFASLQSPTATLAGRVVDPNREVVTGAKVEATNEETNVTVSAETSADGRFVLPNLPTGRYRVTVQKEGFQTIVKPDVDLHVQDHVSLNFTMDVGSVVQSVTVEAGTSAIRTQSATVGTLIDRQFVENLPDNGRGFQTLIEQTPGTVITKSTGANLGQFSVNGQRADANYFTIDGVSGNVAINNGTKSLSQTASGNAPGFSALGGTNNLVSIDALQEFRILTSTYAPEFGRTPGAQVSVVTRSGTNDFHGSLFDYFRNDALDANNWFNNANRLPKAPERQNDFGGVFGGPVFLPWFGASHRYDGRNRTFFFFSYEGLRLLQPQTASNVEVPSLAMRQGAPASLQPLLNAFPLPNGAVLPMGLAQFSASYSNPSTLDATSIRIDHTANRRVTIFGRYNNSPSESSTRSAGALGNLSNMLVTEFNIQTLTAGATISISPRVINEVRANYSRFEGDGFNTLDNFGGAAPPTTASFFPSGFSPANGEIQLILGFGGSPGLSLGKIAANVQRQFNLVDNISMVKASHEMKFGIDYRRLSPVFDPQAYFQTARFTNSAAVSHGTAFSATIQAFQGTRPLFTNFSAFAQDTWRATSRLTLTYGLRWDVNPAPSEANGSLPFTFNGLDNPATLTLAPRGTLLYKTTYNNFAPRAGIAYQLSQSKGWETVLRGGAGIFYDLGNAQAGSAFIGFPNTTSKTLANVPYPLAGAAALPASFSLAPMPGAFFEVFDTNVKLPRTYQWNVAVEQSLGTKQTISATYVGAIGRDLMRRTGIRTLPAAFAGDQVFLDSSDGTSDYHALQLQFQRRLSRGLQALTSYSWSHSIDDASDDIASSILSGRGPSDFDIRHAFSAGISYDIPSPSEGVARALLGHWSLDSSIRAQSATPVNVLASSTPIVLSGLQANVRPNLVPGIPLYLNDPTAPGGRRFNDTVDPSRPGCKGPFCPPAAGQQGTLPRNALRGFPVYQFDVALRRQLKFTERLNLQLRADFFNIFNHPNFGDPNNILTSSAFGRATTLYAQGLGSGGTGGGLNPLYQIGGPRSIQLALRLQF
jgi:hypothetical protein